MKKNPALNPLPTYLLTMSGTGDVRNGPVPAIQAVLTDLGVRRERAFAQAGVDLRLFDDAESRIHFESLGTLLGTCVVLTA